MSMPHWCRPSKKPTRQIKLMWPCSHCLGCACKAPMHQPRLWRLKPCPVRFKPLAQLLTPFPCLQDKSLTIVHLMALTARRHPASAAPAAPQTCLIGNLFGMMHHPSYKRHPAMQPDFLERLRVLAPDLCVTAAYGNILPQAFLDIPRWGTLNIHPSLLPKYRGAAPVQRQLQVGRNCDALGFCIWDSALMQPLGEGPAALSPERLGCHRLPLLPAWR